MASPRGTVPGNADLPDQTWRRAQPNDQGALMCMASPRGTSPCNAGLLGRTRERALPNDKGALMCMASPRGTVSGNADLPGRTRERAQPAPLLPGEKAENRGKAPGYFPQQRRPLGPDKAAGTARPGLLRGGKGFYVSSVIMLLGPPGTIPRRACCGGCVSWAAYGQARLGRRQGKNWDRAKSRCGEK